jgi:predicted small secreted protein
MRTKTIATLALVALSTTACATVTRGPNDVLEVRRWPG